MSNPFTGSLSGFSPGGWSGPIVSSAKQVARVGDSGSHGGVLTGPGSPSTKIDGGIKVCRVGDIYGCPIHGPNPITSGSGITKVDGAALARVSDTTACGATITSGSPTWANA